MQISESGLDLIKSFEGYHRKLKDGRCTTYRCPANVLTIGYGCTEGITDGEIWTHDEALAALRKEIATFEAGVIRLVTVSLNQNEFDALVSFAYNCGVGALGKSSLLKKLNAGDRKGAASAFKLWNKGGGRVLRGLVDRRAREATLFLTPVVEPEAPAMPQAVEASPEKPSKGVVATIAATVSGGAGLAIPQVPTEPIAQLVAWQSAGQQVQGLITFATGNLWLTGGVVAVIAAVWVLPKFARTA